MAARMGFAWGLPSTRPFSPPIWLHGSQCRQQSLLGTWGGHNPGNSQSQHQGRGDPGRFQSGWFSSDQRENRCDSRLFSQTRQGFATPPGYNEFDKVHFLERIRDARSRADLVCVSIHWGEEFILIPCPPEREIARAMVEAGAGVVVGHHPHVLREVEYYRDGVIAHSLGNFIGDMVWNPLTRETGCLVVEAKGSRIQNATLFPGVIDHDYFPRYLDESESRKYLKTQKSRHACLYMDLESSGYELLGRKLLKDTNG